ncbi:Calx-beta domain-containing protein [Actinokineospora sp. UTMC 2448]|uniref:Calx-beta domain-containing protein n=1 Tax=Actinokineospora sp. UTMC 2448 TaxID=2268449 RepID=UPI0021FE9C94|nr:sodium/calcium exchanger 1 [Actinokineospora sp. UTMC 2448]
MRRSTGRRQAAAIVVAVTASLMTATASAASAAPPGVSPSTVDVTLGPGATTTVTKTVTTAEVPPNPDLVLLADTTGSMGGAIANVKANAGEITGDVLAAQPSAQFAVAEYKDFTDPFAYRLNQNTTGDPAAIQAGIDQWTASGGGDFPEGQINALYEIATGSVAFRPGSSRILAMFGDAPGHDPSGGHTLADAIAALQAADVRVIVVNVGNIDLTGQATALVEATGGVLLTNVPADQVSQAILDGIAAIEVTVTPQVGACDDEIDVVNTPASRTVVGGESATFTETIGAAPDAAPGVYTCSVDYLVNGVSAGYVQTVTVRVPGFSIDDVTTTEPDLGATAATFTVTLSTPSPSPVSVRYATADGTATAPGDYAASSGTLTFAPGETSEPVTVQVVGDTVDELTENYTVTLSDPVGAGLIDPVGVGTIVDADRDGAFSCSATALKVAGISVAKANPQNLPCVDDAETVVSADLNAGLINVGAEALTADTDLTPDDQQVAPQAGDNARAHSAVERTGISTVGLKIELGVVEASAAVTCVPGPDGLRPVFTGHSHIASLKINGVAVTVGSAPLTIPLVIGSLKLNSQTVQNGVLVQRAVSVETPLTTIVVAEAKADIHGSSAHPSGDPCRR